MSLKKSKNIRIVKLKTDSHTKEDSSEIILDHENIERNVNDIKISINKVDDNFFYDYEDYHNDSVNFSNNDLGLLSRTPHVDKIKGVTISSNSKWVVTIDTIAIGLWKVDNPPRTAPIITLWQTFPITFPELYNNESVTLSLTDSCKAAVSCITIPNENHEQRDLLITNKKTGTTHTTLIVNFNSEGTSEIDGYSPHTFDKTTRGFVRFLSDQDQLAIFDSVKLYVFNAIDWSKIYEYEIPFNKLIKDLSITYQTYILEQSIDSDHLIWTENFEMVKVFNIISNSIIKEFKIDRLEGVWYIYALSPKNDYLVTVGTNDMATVYSLEDGSKIFERLLHDDIGDDSHSISLVSFIERKNQKNFSLKLLICGRNEFSGHFWVLVYDILRRKKLINNVQGLLPPWPISFHNTTALFLRCDESHIPRVHDIDDILKSAPKRRATLPINRDSFNRMQTYYPIEPELMDNKIIYHHETKIQHLSLSLNGKYVGTYSEEDGIICIWEIKSDPSLNLIDSWKTSDRPKHAYFTRNQSHTKRISIAVSNVGDLALSCFVISQTTDYFKMNPFTLDGVASYSSQCLLLKAGHRHPSYNPLFRNTCGAVYFTESNHFIIYNVSRLYYFELEGLFCVLKHSLDLTSIVNSIRNIYETTSVQSIILENILHGELLIAEEDSNVLTAWDIKSGHVHMRFLCQEGQLQPITDDMYTTYSISENKKILALISRSGILKAFLIESGLQLPMPGNICSYSRIYGFLDNYRIVVEEAEKGQAWIIDIYNGQFLHRVPESFGRAYSFRAVDGGILVTCKGNKPILYNFGEKSKDFPMSNIPRKAPSEIVYEENNVKWWSIRGVFEMQKGSNSISISIEPWNLNDGLGAYLLNDSKKILIFGTHTIQIYTTEDPKLIFIWSCCANDQIIDVNICENNETNCYLLVDTMVDKFKVILPSDHQDFCYESIIYYCKFLGTYSSHSRIKPSNVSDSAFKSWSNWIRLTSAIIKQELRNLLKDLILDTLHTGKYVPHFYDIEKKKSSLSIAIESHKTTIVSALINYYVEKAIKNHDPGWLRTIVPCLSSLCGSYPDLVQKIISKVMFIKVKMALGKIHDENYRTGGVERSDKEYLYAFTFNGSLQKHHYGLFKYWLKYTRILGKPLYILDEFLEKLAHTKSHPVKLCVLPLPGFLEYDYEGKREPGCVGRFNIWNRSHSVFSDLAFKNDKTIFNGKMMQVVSNQKWNAFGRRYFLLNLFVHILYYTIYVVTLTDKKKWEFSIVIILASWFLYHETRQLIYARLKYFRSFYNWIDIGVYFLPLIISMYYVLDKEPDLRALEASSGLLIWIHLVCTTLGVFINIIIEVVRKITWFLVVLAIVIVAFTHAFKLYLEDLSTPSGSSYNGNITTPASSGDITLQQTPGDNVWNSYDSSLAAVIYFLAGDFSAIDPWSGDVYVKTLKVLFFLSTTIVLLNLLIALMGDIFTKAKENGKRAWLELRAEYLAEIECFHMSTYNKSMHSRGLIYYEADPDEIEDWQLQTNFKSKNIFNIKKSITTTKKSKSKININVNKKDNDQGGDQGGDGNNSISLNLNLKLLNRLFKKHIGGLKDDIKIIQGELKNIKDTRHRIL
ncbi:1389_t:CDS:10 [Entrophospora sp. SA101]|nr:1389_t:CDS:10 [Entrophospora sp. SA101]